MAFQGFKVFIRTGDTEQAVRVQGSGGLLGDGCLHITDWNEGKLSLVCQRLQAQAERMLRTDGALRILVGWDLPLDERYTTITPDEVLRVEAYG